MRRTLSLLAVLALGCPSPPRAQERSAEGSASSAPVVPHAREKDASQEPVDVPDGSTAQGRSAEAGAALVLPPDDPMDLHLETGPAILSLFLPTSAPDGGVFLPPAGLRSIFALEAGRFSQGNKRISRHAVGRQACLEGLRGIVIQSEEQRTICHGFENMVPIDGPAAGKRDGGERGPPKACIDVFEFPNRACELPVVWGTPSEAANVCSSQGKRLCSQQEWNRACAGDPDGKPDTSYAYGDELDLAICNTNKPHPLGPNGLQTCDPRTPQAAWATCGTDTEPSGAFPRCRSRMGVFDQHGNVAEMMTRKGEDGVIYDQLKGSAFFYVDVSRKPNEPQGAGRETYPDHCGYDPRWHVEVAAGALHSNYHLGFRCCASL